MSFAIECDGIRVEADCESVARKELKRLQKIARKEREEHKRKEALAEMVAKARGFHVMERILAGIDCREKCRGWRVIGVDAQGSAVKSVREGYAKVILRVVDCGESQVLGGCEGYQESSREVYAYGFDGVLMNGAGQPMVLWIVETIGEDSAPYAIAGVDGAVGLVPMPQGVRPELFRKAGE